MGKLRSRLIWFSITAIIMLMAVHYVCSGLKEFGGIVKGARDYQTYEEESYDNVYKLRTVKYADGDSIGVSFVIYIVGQEETVYECPDIYRAYDLYYMNWINGTNDIYVDSHDVGASIYRHVNGEWKRENSEMNLYTDE